MKNDNKSSGKKPAKNQIRKINALEALKDLGSNTAKTFGDEIKQSQKDILKQLFGSTKTYNKPRHYSGEISQGDPLSIDDVLSGKKEADDKAQKQLTFEKTLIQEEKMLVEKKGRELRIKLQEIMFELKSISQSLTTLDEQTKMAIIEAPSSPGNYHIFFFEKILEYLKGFRKKIENANLWMIAANKRSQKRNYWSMYKKHGGSFLLSGEHYSQRSAG